MIDPERILRQLLTGILGSQSGRRTGHGTHNSAVGMGLLGVAIAAYEHFSEQNIPASASAVSSPPVQAATMTPPPPPPGSDAKPAGIAVPPPAPILEADPDPDPNRHPAAWLIRAMVAAAFADGEMDVQERNRIVRRLEQSGMDDDAVRFIETELAGPRNLDEIVTAAFIFGMPKEFYAASFSAIHVDTDAENNYLGQLQHKLQLSEADIKAIQQQTGV